MNYNPNNNNNNNNNNNSLGNSLMRDLLSDISGPESSNDYFSNLASLEQELDSNGNDNVNNNGNGNGNENGIAPPGLINPSAGAMIVGHASHSTPFRDARTSTNTNTNTTVSAQDAFAQSLQQFSALSLTDDFLKADSARKEHNLNSGPFGSGNGNGNGNDNDLDLVNNLFQGEDTEEYDVQQDADVLAKNQGRDQMAQLFPGFGGGTGGGGGAGGANVGAGANGGGIKSTQTPQAQQHQQGRPGAGMAPPHMRGPPPPGAGSNGPPTGPGPHGPPPHMMHHPPHMMGPPGHGQGQGMPPHMMGPGNGMPPPHHMMHHGPGPPRGPGPHGMGPPPPHHMQSGPNGPGNGNGMPMPPPHHMMMMHMQQQQQMMQQQQAMQANQNQGRSQGQQGHVPPGTASAMQQHPPPQQQQQQQKAIATKVFKTTDFPALGADASQIEQEREEEEKNEQIQKEERRQEARESRQSRPSAAHHPNSQQQQQQQSQPHIRMTFHNPSPNAAPIPANAIQCTSMTSRDLCYVLHSMLRPVLSHASVLDAYNADYYRWSYDDRKSRNLLFLGGNAPSHMNTNLPNPVWKETKVKAQAMEDKFRTTIEKRADEWTKEKQALGRVVKVNVKRPRALLATTSLSSSSTSSSAGDNQKDSGDTVADTEEDRQRAFLWAGRVAIDKGYQAYLSLVELRRLLQSRPGDALNGEDSVIHRREELLKDVEENVNKLQGAFGLKKVDGGIECDDKILARTLTLPKGRMLLSRVVDEGILPHPSACKVLPNAIKVVFDSASTGDLAAAPPAGEDRLLRSLTGLVKTEHPSVDPTNLLQCLISTINAETVINGEKRSMKTVLTSKRTLMELLYAVFSRGGEVCVGGFEADWKEKESKFLAILSAS